MTAYLALWELSVALSNQTQPGGVTTAWKAVVVIRIATTIMASRFLVNHFIG